MDKLYNKDGTVECVLNKKELDKILKPFKPKWYQRLRLRLRLLKKHDKIIYLSSNNYLDKQK